MKKITRTTLTIFCCLHLLISCEQAGPEKYFSITVLNSNMIVGFANEGFLRELNQPSVTLVEGTRDQTRPMKRRDVVNDRIRFVEGNLKKLRELKETTDTKEILQASIRLHEFILPVYKTEYQQLADMYDDGAPADKIRNSADAIHDKYSAGFEERYNILINSGKMFASKYKIPVNWAN
ncbi:MAG: hypothetical protein DI535_09510 [Citrobacter freundii]|nr:MAG: hypothetical protein DI535_09510 [Citrobacter freundii]